LILAKSNPTDQLILDENGKNFLVCFSEELQRKFRCKTLVFVISGPYGFFRYVYAKSQGKISLSLMTFSHQMVRLFYRTIVSRLHDFKKRTVSSSIISFKVFFV
jgi:23S rRNA (pseudouridine1915-N3)-methyltransferase